MLTKHLSTMIRAGIPLLESLSTLEKQAKSKAGKAVIAGVRDEVEGGVKFATALSKYPKSFDPMYIGMIQIAEESGTLEESLSYLVIQLTKNIQLKKKIKAALMYPTLVVAVAVVMGGLIAIFVLPKLTGFFLAIEVELPLSTRVLLWIANFMEVWGWLVGIGIIAMGIIWKLLMRGEGFRRVWQKMLMRMPAVGRVVSESTYAQLMRNLGMMVKNGVPMLSAIDTVTRTMDLLPVRDVLEKVAEEVKGGMGIGESMEKVGGKVFPSLLIQMVMVGGKTGKIEETLLYLADYYEDEVDEAAKTLNTLLEPILLILVGLMVAWIALAVISPIYELTGSIR